jgi:hypothetical protein
MYLRRSSLSEGLFAAESDGMLFPKKNRMPD